MIDLIQAAAEVEGPAGDSEELHRRLAPHIYATLTIEAQDRDAQVKLTGRLKQLRLKTYPNRYQVLQLALDGDDERGHGLEASLNYSTPRA